MRKKMMGLVAVASCVTLVVALSACAPGASQHEMEQSGTSVEAVNEGEEVSVAGLPRPDWVPAGGMNGASTEEEFEAYQESLVKREQEAAEKYVPEVKTMADGAKVQKTPNDERFWNTAILDADHRGCTSCHSLESAIENTPIAHASIQTVGKTELNVYACIGCHTDLRTRDASWGMQFALNDAIHTTHLNSKVFKGEQYNGTCFSCHENDPQTGELKLWEEVKYDVLSGITNVSDVKGSFSFDQDVCLPLENSFWRGSDNTVPGGTLLGGDVELKPFDDAFYQSYTIKVQGEVNNPFEINVADYPESDMKTLVMRQRCEIDGPDSGLISNYEFQGIPLSEIVAKADPKDGANGIHFKIIDEPGFDVTFPLEWALSDQNANAMLGLRVDGEKLTPGLGYPATILWSAGNSCETNLRFVTAIEIVHVDDESTLYTPAWCSQRGVHAPDSEKALYAPSVAVVNAYEGQIWEAGSTDTISLEGYADAFNDPITAVEFSLDHGKTWDRFETPGTTNERWVYWNYDFPMQAPGSYVLTMRAEAASGAKSPIETHFLINVQ